MRSPGTPPAAVLRLLPWAVPVAGAVIGRLVARRGNEGDESTAGIRRVVVLGGIELRPVHPELSRLRLDLLMGGARLDLTGHPRVPGGVDLTVRALMGGVSVRAPAGWHVWWSSRGPGGVRLAEGADVIGTADERGADLRVHADLVFAGVVVETVPQDDGWSR